MQLKAHQKYALLLWLGSKLSGDQFNPGSFHEIIHNFDEFCNGNIREWRIIWNFGFAGKLWNNHEDIYVTGYSPGELSKSSYAKQQKIIEQWNAELRLLLQEYAPWECIPKPWE